MMTVPWRRSRAVVVAATIAAISAAFSVVAFEGARQDKRNERVLFQLDPVVGWIAALGRDLTLWSSAHADTIGWIVTLIAAATAVMGLVAKRRSALPLVAAAAAISLAGWGQIFLLADRTVEGVYLYAAGTACAFLLGLLHPAPWRLSSRDRGIARSLPWECLAVFGMTVIGLLARAYALNQLPSQFNAENILSMLASRTVAGLRTYVPGALLGNTNGLVHLLPQMALYDLVGTSTYSLRLVAVLFGVMAIPIFYGLVRRLAGPMAAFIGTALLLTAPEQLYWSRLESTAFAPIALLALISAHLALWMLPRFSAASVGANAIWLPFTRYFYVAGVSMLAYPWLLYAHAVVFVHGAWRKSWYVVALLAAGTVLWVFSLSAVQYVVTGEWRFLNPARQGEAITRRDLEGRNAGPIELARLQAVSLARNLGSVAAAMTDRTTFSPWYERAQDEPHATVINVGLAIVLACGLGYLAGQIQRPQAFALLAWVAVGLLPGVLSLMPAERRIALIFPAFYVIAGVTVEALRKLARDCGGRLAGATATTGLGLAVAAILCTNLSSHFLLRKLPLPADAAVRFTEPLFVESDAIYHGLDARLAVLLAFGNADPLLAVTRPPCYQAVPSSEWLRVALLQPCDFGEEALRYMFSPESLQESKSAYEPHRIAFLLRNRDRDRPYVDLVRGLYPGAQVERTPPTDSIDLISFRVDRAAVDALRSPVVFSAHAADCTDLETGLLAGVRLHCEPPDDRSRARADEIVMRGGALIERDGWYSLAVEPKCPDASLQVDGTLVLGERLRPLLAGVHRLDLALRRPTACGLPLNLRIRSSEGRALTDDRPVLLDPFVASVPGAGAPTIATYAGYGAARPFADIPGTVLDFGVDADGVVHALTQEAEAFRVLRFTADGNRVGEWQPAIPGGAWVEVSVMGRNGSWLIGFERTALVYDANGNQLGQWPDPSFTRYGVAFLASGEILSCVPGHAAIAVSSPDARAELEWKEFTGGPGKFVEPVALATSESGDLLIIQADGLALLFRTPRDRFDPQFVRSFPIAFGRVPVVARGTTFDGDRIVLSDPSTGATLVYGRNGARMMASDPSDDLATRFNQVLRFQSAGGQLYLLDSSRTLWVLSPLPPDGGVG